MIKLAMTQRVGAGAPVDALLFEARLNLESVKRGNGCERTPEKPRSPTGIWTPQPKSCKMGLHPSSQRFPQRSLSNPASCSRCLVELLIGSRIAEPEVPWATGMKRVLPAW